MNTIIARIGDFVKRHTDTAWHILILGLIAWSGYNLGLLSSQRGALPAQSSGLLQVRDSAVSQKASPAGQGSLPVKTPASHSDPRVVASKTSSSKKYHHTWCSSGQRIKEANRLWFPTAQAAQAAGYTLAGNCTE